MNKIKELRLKKNIKQKDLADLLSVTPRQIQRYERNNDSISVSKAIILADFFNVNLDYLFDRKIHLNKLNKDVFHSEEQLLFNSLNDENKELALNILNVIKLSQK